MFCSLQHGRRKVCSDPGASCESLQLYSVKALYLKWRRFWRRQVARKAHYNSVRVQVSLVTCLLAYAGPYANCNDCMVCRRITSRNPRSPQQGGNETMLRIPRGRTEIMPRFKAGLQSLPGGSEQGSLKVTTVTELDILQLLYTRSQQKLFASIILTLLRWECETLHCTSCLAAAFGCTVLRNAVIAHCLDSIKCYIKFDQASDAFYNSV